MLGFPASLGEVALAEIPSDGGGGGGADANNIFPFIANMGTLMKRWVWMFNIMGMG